MHKYTFKRAKLEHLGDKFDMLNIAKKCCQLSGWPSGLRRQTQAEACLATGIGRSGPRMWAWVRIPLLTNLLFLFYFVSFLICLILCGAAFGQEGKLPVATDLHSHGVTQNQIESLAKTLRQAVQQERIAGCSFLVAHKGEIVYRKAHGAFTTGF